MKTKKTKVVKAKVAFELEIAPLPSGALPTLEGLRRAIHSGTLIKVVNVENLPLWACPHCKSTNVQVTNDGYVEDTYTIPEDGGTYGYCVDRDCQEEFNDGEDMELIDIAESLK